jgi:DNA-binding PadR family transcriptional regulator
MDTTLLLLGLLRQASMHGYQLMEFIERNLSTCTDIKKPTAYLALDRLAQQGWIAEREVREGKRPPRRVYTITPSGEAEFRRLLALNLSAYNPAKFPQDLGLAFADALPPAEVARLLEQRRARLETELAAARSAPAHAGALQLLVEHSVFHLESELAWLDRVVSAFSESAAAAPTFDAPAVAHA